MLPFRFLCLNYLSRESARFFRLVSEMQIHLEARHKLTFAEGQTQDIVKTFLEPERTGGFLCEHNEQGEEIPTCLILECEELLLVLPRCRLVGNHQTDLCPIIEREVRRCALAYPIT